MVPVPGKQEALEQLAGRQLFALLERHELGDLVEGFNHLHALVKHRGFLAEMAEDNGVANDHFSAIGRVLSRDEADEGALAGSVVPDEAHALARFEVVGPSVEDDALTVSLPHAVQFEDLPAESGGIEFQSDVVLLQPHVGAALEVLEGVEAGFALSGAGLGSGADPFEFAAHDGAGAVALGMLVGGTLGFHLEEITPVARVFVQSESVQFEDGVAHHF